MKLKTSTGDVYMNPQLISLVHLSPDHSFLIVHFVNGTHFTAPSETDEERTFVAAFLGKLSDESSGFVAIGTELVNLKSALWITIPEEGPIQVHLADNRTHTLRNENLEQIKKILGE